ncbi:MAG TPA: S8 family serine peptidase [Rugosimonospora sp.]|nr:S8 family serine peptidase [Rugosimonospora sp.]
MRLGILAVAVVAATAPVAAGRPPIPGGWQGQWMGSASTVVSARLSDVRTMIGASSGPAATLTGAGVGIALIDTGVAPVDGLPASQVVNGPDLSFESQAPALRYLDTYGHGTHMAGIMVGNGTYTGNVGLAPKAKLTSIKVGAASGAVDITQIIAALDWVVQHRNDDPAYPIRVVNLAYGTGGEPSHYTDPVMAAVEQAWKAGIVVVAAAGNGPHTKMSDPAIDPFVLSVGSAATYGTLTNADDTASTFNNGSNVTITYDLVAPGEGILSLRNPGSSIDTQYPAARQGDYLFRGSGSSQATAVTSAGVALLLQARPTLTPDQVVQVLTASATIIADGRKMLNIARAVYQPIPAFTPRTIWSSGTGLLEDTRGSSHVVVGSTVLSGENSIFGPFSTTAWAARSQARTAWAGGVWMGNRFAGDGWTGTSWASRTWGAATWTGLNWAAQPWADPSWTGHYWSGHYWSGGTWDGHYWTSDDWSAAAWG